MRDLLGAFEYSLASAQGGFRPRPALAVAKSAQAVADVPGEVLQKGALLLAEGVFRSCIDDQHPANVADVQGK